MPTFGQNWMGPTNPFANVDQSTWDSLFGQGGMFGSGDVATEMFGGPNASDMNNWKKYYGRLGETLLGALGKTGVWSDPTKAQDLGQNLYQMRYLADVPAMRTGHFFTSTGADQEKMQQYLQKYLQGGDMAGAMGLSGNDFAGTVGDIQRNAAADQAAGKNTAGYNGALSALQDYASRTFGGARLAAMQGALGQLGNAAGNPGGGGNWWGAAPSSPYAGIFGFGGGQPGANPPVDPANPPANPAGGVVGNTGGGIGSSQPTPPAGGAADRFGSVGYRTNAPAGMAARTGGPSLTADPVVTAETVMQNNPFEGNWDSGTTIEALNDFAAGAGRQPTLSELLAYLQTHYGDRRKTVATGTAAGLAGVGPLGAGTGVRA